LLRTLGEHDPSYVHGVSREWAGINAFHVCLQSSSTCSHWLEPVSDLLAGDEVRLGDEVASVMRRHITRTVHIKALGSVMFRSR
jgi:hypothetical protein